MKLNSDTQINGNKIILVPYRKKHVEKYHVWMESEELRKQTASERLSLEEEYEMQQTWLNDEEKCTFIVLDKNLMDETDNEIVSMVGDANLYIQKDGDCTVGEIGLMIAEPSFRSCGRGSEAALFILRYGVEKIGINKYLAVISSSNVTSINLFKKFNFVKENESEVFQEITLSRKVDSEWISWLRAQTPSYAIEPTEPNF
ncbi:N-acetyltransferase 9-like protein [Halyomorpha halys]|uniref:N-acetyltransferase 9-like protein n=1 Tax=Halyomorpha halys TaxID=286706 RepID=UPI0006D4F789